MREENGLVKTIERMSCFKGPLGGHKNYIVYIALPNCVDYFNLLESNREKKRISTPDKFKEFRYFINAVESLNNIPDYLYFERAVGSRKTTQKEFRANFRKLHAFHMNIARIANAYKHCFCGQNSKKGNFIKYENVLHARDLTKNEVRFSANMRCGRSLVEIQYSFNGIDIDNEELIQEAFKYWVNYINNDKGEL